MKEVNNYETKTVRGTERKYLVTGHTEAYKAAMDDMKKENINTYSKYINLSPKNALKQMRII